MTSTHAQAAAALRTELDQITRSIAGLHAGLPYADHGAYGQDLKRIRDLHDRATRLERDLIAALSPDEMHAIRHTVGASAICDSACAESASATAICASPSAEMLPTLNGYLGSRALEMTSSMSRSVLAVKPHSATLYVIACPGQEPCGRQDASKKALRRMH